ncbi:hypothetical protein [Streptococcus sanguinis]|jgi:hypothetical protein|uniref:hypothetical protein n=1 Tax=Streptococcus sanguinis TaxID=1305 RepID=UPI0016597413|nr:hypothetical protein [Streptococcus sanguinis]
MTPNEKKSREAIIAFLMKETGSTRKQTLENMKELESFGLIGFNSKGDFRLREV